MSQTTLSGNSKIDALLSTYQWGTVNGVAQALTYSFPTTGSTWVADYGDSEPFSPNSYSALSPSDRPYFAQALELYSDVANLIFSETADNSLIDGDIRVAFSTVVTGGTAGYAYYPTHSSSEEAGDVWLNTTTDSFYPDGQGFSVFVHELGHAFGLKHSFEAGTKNSIILTGSEDSNQYTVMSYTNYAGVGYIEDGNSNSFYKKEPSTLMLYDIAAIQFLYGANTATRTGDDVYSFSNSSPEFMTIWDAGGVDTFDLSNQSLAMDINLNAGSFSSLGVVTHKLVNGSIRATNEAAVDNVAIAYNVDIEKAIGGSGDDVITGNGLANELTGGGGNDSIIGGDGYDTVVYSGNEADYQLQKTGETIAVRSLVSNEGTDTLTGVEKLQFADKAIDAETLTEIGSLVPSKPSEVDLTPVEGDSNHINYFLLQIGAVLTEDASVEYTTRDGTAFAGEDYVFTSGVATIKAGETSTVIGVEIIADLISESDETFSLAITNPQGGIFPEGVAEITALRTIVDDDTAAVSANMIDDIQLIGIADTLSA